MSDPEIDPPHALRVLALNPFHAGSHRAFLDDWKAGSRHEWTVLPLPGRHWKWRMRHAAMTFAEEIQNRFGPAPSFDVLFCTDMLNLAELYGLLGPSFRRIPSVIYFHENQLTYAVRFQEERDLHFAMTNLISALAATEAWFNSAFHREEFLDALTAWLPRLPDYPPTKALDEIREKARVQSPGIRGIEPRFSENGEPLSIVWVSRWEHDKNPDLFFAALDELETLGVDFRLNILGESYSEMPRCFEKARVQFASKIQAWGFRPDRSSYEHAVAESDVVVSTARHEFFGIAVLEAVSAGCFPLVPQRLAYPETLGEEQPIFHDETPAGIAKRLAEIARWKISGQLRASAKTLAQRVRDRHDWQQAAPRLDAALNRVKPAPG